MQVFGKEWFKKHNKILCLIANSFLGDWLFKFTQYGHDLKSYGKITEIHPNAITHKKGLLYNFKKHKFEQEYTTQFFTRNEYALRLQQVFYPIWFLFHCWDMFANKFKPAWNLGFDELTAYPDADPETNTVDGSLYNPEIRDTWSNVVNGAGYSANDTDTYGNICLAGTGSDATLWDMQRAIFLFNTSALTSSVTISGATLSFFGKAKTKYITGDDQDVNIYTSNPNSNTALTATDFAQIGATPQCDTAITYSGFSVTGYNDFAFNAIGIGNISKTGISKFGTRNANYDVANISPNEAVYTGYSLTIWFADNGSNKPKLVITYTIPLNIAITAGNYILTGKDIVLNQGKSIVISTGGYILAGLNIIINAGFHNRSKNSTTFTNRAKNSATFTNRTKNSATLSNQTKNSTSFTNRSKNTTSFTNRDK